MLSNKQKQSTIVSERYEIQGDESEVDGRNSNQGNKGIRNNEDIIKLTQNGIDKNGEEGGLTRMKMKQQVIIVMTRIMKNGLV